MQFDRTGAYVAGLFFLAVLAFLTLVFAVNLRKPELGRMKLSRRTRIIGFTALSMVYLAVIWGWLFGRRFYELRVAERGAAVDLIFVMPERELRLSTPEIADLAAVPSPKGSLRQLQIVTSEDRRYRSPELTADEASRLLRWLREELDNNPRPFQGAEVE